MCRWQVEGKEVEVVHRALVRHHRHLTSRSAFDQQAFTEAVGIAVTAIAQACAIVSQGGSSDLQRLDVHQPPLGREGGVDDMRGIQDMGVGTKRKEDPSSSSVHRQNDLGNVDQGWILRF